MEDKKQPYYSNYLELDKILKAQHLKSDDVGAPVHDEMLFIIIHQTYELWFKQIIHDLDSITLFFKDQYIEETKLSSIVNRLNRVCLIQELLIDQIKILETMTPMDFLEFRNLLNPASGFQSLQFRLIENKLGLKRNDRLKFSKKPYDDYLNKDDKKDLNEVEDSPTLYDYIEKWLERTPFLSDKNFDFWKEYQSSIDAMLSEDIELIKENKNLSQEEINNSLAEYEKIAFNYNIIFNAKEYDKLLEKGIKRLSQKATLAALFIMLYREEPILDLPYRLLTKLIDIDSLMNKWRYGHALLAHRMIGRKIGTGGSAGSSYLKKTMEKHSVFNDITNLSTYLIPRSSMPKLPSDIKNKLGYYFNNDKK